MMQLVRPQRAYLGSYLAALERGWSPNTTDSAAGFAEAKLIADDADAFLAGLDDPQARGPRITLPDGTTVDRLPSFRRWMWDGEFCGSINLRWQHGTTDLPPTCLGHAGYAVVPWKRGRGYATEALRLLLPEAAAVGLPFIDLTADADNIASQRVVERNGGVLVEEFVVPIELGGEPAKRYRISLTG
jgi:predicted acetyltransferase